jgi:uncharacterized protein
MKDLVTYMAQALVDDPTQVTVTEVDAGSDLILELRVGPGDMGRVIGRQGRVVNAMRALVQLCAARDGRRAQLEIID